VGLAGVVSRSWISWEGIEVAGISWKQSIQWTLGLALQDILKVWWQDATLFVYFSYFITYSTYIHSITFIQYIYLSPFAEVSLHLFIACMLSGKILPVVPSRELNYRDCPSANRRATN
jgi:hypothetical protein